MDKNEFVKKLNQVLEDKKFELSALVAFAKQELGRDFSSSRAIEEIEYAVGNLQTAQMYFNQSTGE